MKLIVLFLLILSNLLVSQTELQIQYRNRGELNASLTEFSTQELNSNYSTGQRTRIGIFHKNEDYDLGIQLQDVRFWGQDRSTIAYKSDNQLDGLIIHQAFLNLKLNKILDISSNLKVGRQEIHLDDQRLFGALDWAHQARRHDIAILDLEPNTTNSLKIGIAFNQNGYKKQGSIFDGVGGIYPSGTNGLIHNYKSLLLAYYENSNSFLPFNVLLVNDNFTKFNQQNLATHNVSERYTAGIKINKKIEDFKVSLAFYQQMGKTPDGNELNAKMINFETIYSFGKFSTILAYDYLSGTDLKDGAKASNEVNTFDPLYGTAHKYFGFMDFFYGPIYNGLNGFSDLNLKLKYKTSDKLDFYLATHLFNLTNSVVENGNELDKMVGTEVDFVTKYKLLEKVELELGILFMFAGDTLYSKSLLNVNNPNRYPYMFYLTLNLLDMFKL